MVLLRNRIIRSLRSRNIKNKSIKYFETKIRLSSRKNSERKAKISNKVKSPSKTIKSAITEKRVTRSRRNSSKGLNSRLGYRNKV